MKILYGVQGTGNGHLSRARAMARHLANTSAEVTWLFSGRPREQFFDMEAFGDFEVRQGFSFSVKAGKVNYVKTAFTNNPIRFVSEVMSLNVEDYDVILTDFEPVTAWAGKIRKKPVISLGHQPAFRFDIPIVGDDLLARTIMQYFSPASIHIGLHWHHFDCDILPPIIHLETEDDLPVEKNKVLVYLPFEDYTLLPGIFKQMSDHEFYVYHPEHKQAADIENVHVRPLSVDGFQRDLRSASAVVCNAGFELPSECIYLGKKLLVKPVKKQMEQMSNAEALEQLKLGRQMHVLDVNIIREWLEASQEAGAIQYPDVAKELVGWVMAGEWQDVVPLRNSLWAQVAI